MRSVLAKLRAVAPTRATVLLTGETGAGKGFAAKLVHQWSNRRDKPFITVHCGAIPETLIESELFGHEKGSFTGAHRRKHGQFELAEHGTVFLDEVDALPPSAQVKLLEAIQDRSFHRVGGEEVQEVNVRIIAASNSDLNRMQLAGSFRADLYHRLHVFPVEIPPLRERLEDIPGIVRHVLGRLNRLYGKRVEGTDDEVDEVFRCYAWPGNVRELENVVERAHILSSTRRISLDVLPPELTGGVKGSPPEVTPPPTDTSQPLAVVRAAAAAAAERRYPTALLERCDGRINASAEIAGITTRQLRKLLAKHGIRKSRFKHRGRSHPDSVP
jgi:DNA-binding NtrC family response regulator